MILELYDEWAVRSFPPINVEAELVFVSDDDDDSVVNVYAN